MFRDYLNYLKHGPFISIKESLLFLQYGVQYRVWVRTLMQTMGAYTTVGSEFPAFRVMVLLVTKDTEF